MCIRDREVLEGVLVARGAVVFVVVLVLPVLEVLEGVLVARGALVFVVVLVLLVLEVLKDSW